jgi:hypothetical protein
MDVEMLLYNKLDKYGNELSAISGDDLKSDVKEVCAQLSRIPGLEQICKRMLSFLFRKRFSKDDIAETLLQAIRKLEAC